jgi:hypothetical protein
MLAKKEERISLRNVTFKLLSEWQLERPSRWELNKEKLNVKSALKSVLCTKG